MTLLDHVGRGGGPRNGINNFGGNQNAMGLGLQPWPYPTGGIGQPGQWNDISENNRLFSLVEIDHLPSSSTNPAPPATNTPPATDTSPGNTPPASPAPPEYLHPLNHLYPLKHQHRLGRRTRLFPLSGSAFPNRSRIWSRFAPCPIPLTGDSALFSPVPFKNAFHVCAGDFRRPFLERPFPFPHHGLPRPSWPMTHRPSRRSRILNPTFPPSR